MAESGSDTTCSASGFDGVPIGTVKTTRPPARANSPRLMSGVPSVRKIRYDGPALFCGEAAAPTAQSAAAAVSSIRIGHARAAGLAAGHPDCLIRGILTPVDAGRESR